ncbi:MAG TPA: glutaminase A [Verrucomicrobiae bacterium]|nr:glutaminase A [Verrucomicrobiae bacterium]
MSTAPAPAPASSPVLDYLKELHQSFLELTEGHVATYIPELARANPDWLGICLVTCSGSVYEVGDTAQPFTIQSISKPFVYGLALEDNGRPAVLQKVGVEPTGDAFNSISLDPGTGRPRNPMINAGAISTAGLIAGKTAAGRLRRLQDMLGLYAGRPLDVDEAVYRSESETGHRNRAIGHMLRNFDILSEDPMPVVELYFQQCSVAVTCRDLGVMAATLANRGVNPVTDKQAIRGEYVESVLSVMESCGMYDYAGQWIYNIGLPAKSGVSGGVIAVLPGQLGIGVFSPRLDNHGNSVRGIRICQELSRRFDLHVFNPPNVAQSTIRLAFTAADLNSSRVRTPEESQILRELGRSIHVYQLQGPLGFATTEVVVREIMSTAADLGCLLLDCKRVLSLDESACRLLHGVLISLAQQGKPVIFAHADRHPLLRRYLKVKLGTRLDDLFRVFEDDDPALEWCENRLLEANLPGRSLDPRAAVAEYDLFHGLTAAELALLQPRLRRRTYQGGETIIKLGDEARDLFFLARGHVSVAVTLRSGAQRRLATFSAGMSFGEMAVIDRAPRSARIVADTEVECDLLGIADLEQLGARHPTIQIKLLENLSLSLCRKLRKANRELSVFD